MLSRVGPFAAPAGEQDAATLNDWLTLVARALLRYIEWRGTPAAGTRPDPTGPPARAWAAKADFPKDAQGGFAGIGSAGFGAGAHSLEKSLRGGPLLTGAQLSELSCAPGGGFSWDARAKPGAAASKTSMRCAYLLPGAPAPGAEPGPGASEFQVLIVQADSLAGHGGRPVDPKDLLVLGMLCALAYPRTDRLLWARARLVSALSPAQGRIIPFLVTGMSENAVANLIGRSRHTVRDHVKEIYAVWGVRSRVELLNLWRVPLLGTRAGAGAVSRIEPAPGGAVPGMTGVGPPR